MKNWKDGVNLTASVLTIITGSIYLFPGLVAIGSALVSLIYFLPHLNLFNVLVSAVFATGMFSISLAYLSRRANRRFMKRLLTLSDIADQLEGNLADSTIALCDAIADAFQAISPGPRPAVSIQVAVAGEVSSPLRTATLARDATSIRTRDMKPTERPVFENSVFHTLVERFIHDQNNYYLIGDLHKLQPEAKAGQWPLAYRSALCIPIVEQRSAAILGFVALDSKRPNYFREEDSAILAFFTRVFLQPLLRRAIDRVSATGGAAGRESQPHKE